MKDIHYKAKRYIFLIFFCLIAGGMIFLLNHYNRFFLDDYSLMRSCATGRLLTSVSEVFPSMYAYYLRGGTGRIVCHGLIQIFFVLGKPAYDIINSFGFLALCLLICYHGTGERPSKHVLELSFTFCTLILLMPEFAEVFLWFSGAGNYLYGPFILLLYMVPFRASASYVPKKERLSIVSEIVKFLTMLSFGFIAGDTNENTGVALIAMIAAYLIYYRSSNISIKPWMLNPGPLMGLVFQLTAPGNVSRLSNAGGISSIKSMFVNAAFITGEMLNHFYPLLFALAAMLLCYFRSHCMGKLSMQRARQFIKDFSLPLIYFLGFLGSTYSLVVVMNRGLGRIWAGPLYFLIISMLLVYQRTAEDKKEIFPVHGTCILMALLIACTCSIYVPGVTNAKNRARESDARDAYILECGERGETEAAVKGIWSSSKFSVFPYEGDLYYLSPEKSAELNALYAKYLGFDGRIYRDGILHKEEEYNFISDPS